jgi:hypothetical protein
MAERRFAFRVSCHAVATPLARAAYTRSGTIAEQGFGNSEPEYGNRSDAAVTPAAMQCGDFCGFRR